MSSRNRLTRKWPVVLMDRWFTSRAHSIRRSIRTMAGAALALLVLVGARPAAAENGNWFFTEAADGAKAGVVFPDFSPNEFVGMVMSCTPGSGRLEVSLDMSSPQKAGKGVGVELFADGLRTEYQARVVAGGADGASRARFTTSIDDPIVAGISTARRVGFVIAGNRTELPVELANGAVSGLQTRCAAAVPATATGASTTPATTTGTPGGPGVSPPPVSDTMILAGVGALFMAAGAAFALWVKALLVRRRMSIEPVIASAPTIRVVAAPPATEASRAPQPEPRPTPPSPAANLVRFCTECGTRIVGPGKCPACGAE